MDGRNVQINNCLGGLPSPPAPPPPLLLILSWDQLVQALDLPRFWTSPSRARQEELLHRHRRVRETHRGTNTMWGIANKKVWIYGGFYVAIIGTCIFLFLCACWSTIRSSISSRLLVNYYHQRSNMKGAISLLLIYSSSQFLQPLLIHPQQPIWWLYDVGR